MKKIFIILLITPLFLSSCDYILRKKDSRDTNSEELKNIVLGNDKDKHGCVTSAGYRWSEVKQNCIRIFEEGMRLVPANDSISYVEDVNDQALLNAYLIVDSLKSTAEVFIAADTAYTIVLKQYKNVYKNEDWNLTLGKEFKLSKNGKVKFKSPIALERKTIGSDIEE